MNRPTWSKNAIAKIDGKDVVGVIVGKCFHDGRDHFDLREGEKIIHKDIPAERFWL